MSHIVNAKSMFDDYLYLTNTSKQNLDYFKSYATKIKKIMNSKQKLSILDIASNDGTFLKFFNKKKYNRLGIDPAKNLSKFSKKLGISQLQMYFTFNNSKIIKKKFGRFNIITANHVCAHVSDLIDFFKGVKNLLDINGIFVFEISYLGSVIKKKIFDTIYHEHADYHALKPLIQFVKRFGLEIFDFEIVKAQGGSLRVYTCHTNSKKIEKEKIKKQIFFEKNILKLFQPLTYRKFEKEIIKVKDKLNIILDKLKKDKKKVAGYGAAAKTTTLLNYFNINKNTINFIVDDNPEKQGKFTPGDHIIVKPTKTIYEKKPDYLFILAWVHAKKIIENNKKYLDEGGHLIVCFPEIKII